MFAHWTFGRRLAVGFGIAGLALLAIIALAYTTTASLIDNNRRVEHTQGVRLGLEKLMSSLKDAETGQRGFLLTGQQAYLAPYTGALDQVKTLLADLRRLTVDNPEQQQRLNELSPIIDQRMQRLVQGIEARRQAGLDGAATHVETNAGKELMDRIRQIITEADRQEFGLLNERTAIAEGSARQAINIILWGGIAGAIAVALIGWLITSALTRQIGDAVGHLQSSSAELQASANQQATGVKEQVTSMNEINTTISELLATSRQIAESAQRVAQIASETTASARDGDGTVDRATQSILGIRRQVDQIVNHMLDLGKKSQQIGSVLDIVSELAEQTNILSINATIEAAGAGESGRRFGVVADEIRKLAERVAASAKEIRTLIDDVRSSVNTTVMATETGSKAVDSGSRQFGEVAAVFKQIVRLVDTTTEAAREIELSTKQQTTAVEQVNIAVTNVAQATKETEASAGQTIQTATELANTSRDLLNMVQSRSVA